MTERLYITSPEPMNIMGLILFGASTKRDDANTIGQFGTGLKYTIATLLREEIKFEVTINNAEVRIETDTVSLGDSTFEQIYIDGHRTSLTTSLGMNWTPKECLREIVTNAMDIGNHTIEVMDAPPVNVPGTMFSIDINDQVKDFIDGFSEMFISGDREPLFITTAGSVYEKVDTSPQDAVYTKGVHCVSMPGRTSVFDYDCNHLELSELRLAKSNYDAIASVRAVLAACHEPKIMKRILLSTVNINSIEAEAISDLKYGFDNVSGLTKFAKENLVVKEEDLKRLTAEEQTHAIVVSEKAFSGIEAKCVSRRQPLFVTNKEPEYTPNQTADGGLLAHVCQRFKVAGINLEPESIIVADFLKDDVLSMLAEDTRDIVVSTKVLHDAQLLAAIIAEQYIIKMHSVESTSRPFQDQAMKLIALLILK